MSYHRPNYLSPYARGILHGMFWGAIFIACFLLVISVIFKGLL